MNRLFDIFLVQNNRNTNKKFQILLLLLLIFMTQFNVFSMVTASDTSLRKYKEIQTLLFHSTNSQKSIPNSAGMPKSIVNRIQTKMG